MNTIRRYWLVGVATLAAFSLVACEEVTIKVGSKNSVKGSGVSATETRPMAAFSGVELAGVGKLVLKVGEGSSYSVKVTADDNIVPLIMTEVKGDTLRIWMKDSMSFSLNSNTGFVYEVSAPKIVKIDSSGAASIEGSGFDGGRLAVEVSGVGSLALSGRVDDFSADLSGAGSLNTTALVADDVNVDLSGLGSAEVRADRRIRANVSGLGSITWEGAATDVKTSVSGLGSVRKSGTTNKAAEIKINV